MHDEQLRHCRTDDADNVIDDVPPRAEQALDFRSEHVQREHVEEDVRQVACVVQEGIGNKLPDLERRRICK